MAGIITDLKQLYDLLNSLKDLHDTIEGNRERCYLLIDRCQSFRDCLTQLECKPDIESPSIQSGVKVLSSAVEQSVEFVNKYGKRGWKRFCLNATFAHSIQSQFEDLNARLTQAANDLQFGLTVSSLDVDRAAKADHESYLAVVTELIANSDSQLTENIDKLGERLSVEQVNGNRAILTELDSSSRSVLSELGSNRAALTDLGTGLKTEMEQLRALFDSFATDQLQRTTALLELMHQQQVAEASPSSGKTDGSKSDKAPRERKVREPKEPREVKEKEPREPKPPREPRVPKEPKDAKEPRVRKPNKERVVDPNAPPKRKTRVFEIKPAASDTDLEALWNQVRAFAQEGLEWGEAHKIDVDESGLPRLIMIVTYIESLVRISNVAKSVKSRLTSSIVSLDVIAKPTLVRAILKSMGDGVTVTAEEVDSTESTADVATASESVCRVADSDDDSDYESGESDD